MPVNTPHPSYVALKAQWQRLRDCFGGRDAVLARDEYLPALPGNPTTDYGARANFYNAVKRTVQGLAGAITQEEPTFNLPESLKDLNRDLARPRQSGAAFVKRSIDEVLLMGRWGVLVDMPEEGVEGQHAYFYGYRAEDIVSWTVEEIAGEDVVTRVVLREYLYELDPKDRFAYVVVEQYRVLTLQERYEQAVWRASETKNGEWVSVKQAAPMRRGKSLTFIPFIFLGPTSESAEPEAPPLTDLADVNLAHFRNSADHEYGLHLVALPTPWVSGVKTRAAPDDPTGANAPAMAMGPSVVWELDQGGHAGMLEFQGAGLAAIKDAMAAKERQMATLGARLLEEQQTAPETATAVGMRHAGEHATLRTVAQSVSDGLTRALQIVVWWMGTTTSPEEEDVSVELNMEFFQLKATPAQVQQGMKGVQDGQMSYEQFYNLLQTGEWTRPGISAEDELAQIEAEEGERANSAARRRMEEQLGGNPAPPNQPPPPPGSGTAA